VERRISTGDACYVEQLLAQVIRDGPRNGRRQTCTPAERTVVSKALNALLAERFEELSARQDGERLMHAIDIWSDADERGAR
jgi:hypothetical protein